MKKVQKTVQNIIFASSSFSTLCISEAICDRLLLQPDALLLILTSLERHSAAFNLMGALYSTSFTAFSVSGLLHLSGRLVHHLAMQQRQVFSCSLCNLTIPFEVTPPLPPHSRRAPYSQFATYRRPSQLLQKAASPIFDFSSTVAAPLGLSKSHSSRTRTPPPTRPPFLCSAAFTRKHPHQSQTFANKHPNTSKHS